MADIVSEDSDGRSSVVADDTDTDDDDDEHDDGSDAKRSSDDASRIKSVVPRVRRSMLRTLSHACVAPRDSQRNFAFIMHMRHLAQKRSLVAAERFARTNDVLPVSRSFLFWK